MINARIKIKGTDSEMLGQGNISLNLGSAVIYFEDKKITVFKDGLSVRAAEYELRLFPLESLLVLLEGSGGGRSGSMPLELNSYRISGLENAKSIGKIEVFAEYLLGGQLIELDLTAEF